MTVHICYDVTRLLTRLFTATPNGIDRIDAGLAAAVFARSARSGLIVTPLGPRLLSGEAAQEAVAAVAAHWGETSPVDGDPAYEDVVGLLTGPPGRGEIMRVKGKRPRGIDALPRWLSLNAAALRHAPAHELPPGARYVNASQFPLWMRAPFAWLEARRDVKAVFFIHDLLPLTMPERFRAGEAGRHRRRLQTLARFGAGAIVTSEPVRAALTRHLATLGKTLPILVAPPAPAPVFAAPAEPDPRLQGFCYFICCGTIEPRKNHLLLLHVWRRLVARHGAAAPRLVLVGARGWKFGPIVEMLEQCRPLHGHVVEVSGLTTPGLRRLFDGAAALLMPTFAEGFDLPVHEALAAGLPVLCSDIDVFRAIDDARLTRLDPQDRDAWCAAIEQVAARPRDARLVTRAAGTFQAIEDFVSAL